MHNITVIIPTTAEKNRRSSLLEAIDCILSQSEVNALPFVVVNGDRFDKELNEELKNRTDIKYVYLKEGNLVKAIYYGVKNVDTPYFSFLDDDDIYLENALIIRLRPMLENEAVGLAVTNGYKHGIGEEYRLPFNAEEYELDPVAAILKSPWLSSCSGLYRKSLIDPSLFDHSYYYVEWTYLAFEISKITKIAFVNKPTFLYNYSENSLSASPVQEVARARLMDEISQSQISKELKEKFLIQKYNAHHMASEGYLNNREILKAWKHHLKCLVNIHGIKHFSYSYHLCRNTLFP